MCKWGNITTIKINDKQINVDKCIASIIIALNNAGINTVASCCGHNKNHGNIALADGRELIIVSSFEEARNIDEMVRRRNVWKKIPEDNGD